MAALRKINQDNLREHNLSVILRALLSSCTPLSRADLSKATGLTKASVSLLSEILLRNQILSQLKPASESVQGRPSIPLEFASGRWAGIGLQVNTDGYGYAVLDLSGDLVRSEWVSEEMVDVSAEDVFEQLDRLVRPVEAELDQAGYTFCGAGLALPGLVADKRRLVIAKNLGWEDIDLDRFEIVHRLGAKADNEANLAALAQISGYATRPVSQEAQLDSSSSFIYISTDVGIGGAFVRDGQVVSGDHDFGGEFGHVSVNWEGPQCACGRRGCLEAYAGRRALVEYAGIAQDAQGTKSAAADELFRQWHQGAEQAVRAIDRGLDAMVSALASAVNILDIDTIVLGGFWTNFDENLTRLLSRRIQGQVLERKSVSISVLMSPVATHPALLGAATTGLRQLIDYPLNFLTV